MAIILVACSGNQSAEPPGKAYHATWSPGGDQVAYTCFEDGPLERDELGGVSFTTDAAELCVMKADGTNKHRLTRNQGFDFVPSWSPDGTAMAYVAADGLYVTSPQGSDARRLFEGRTIVWDDPQWSPDGSRIAISVCRAIGYLWALHGNFLAYEIRGARTILAVEDLSNGKVTAISESVYGALEIEWSPDGRWLLVNMMEIVPAEPEDIFVYAVWLFSRDGEYSQRLTPLFR